MCHCKKDCRIPVQVLYAWSNLYVFVNVKVCALIIVIGVGNRQTENDLEKDNQDAFKNDKQFN